MPTEKKLAIILGDAPASSHNRTQLINFYKDFLFEGGRPLHHAVARGDIELFNELLEKGADPLLVNHDGRTPQVYAAICFGKGELTLEKFNQIMCIAESQNAGANQPQPLPVNDAADVVYHEEAFMEGDAIAPDLNDREGLTDDKINALYVSHFGDDKKFDSNKAEDFALSLRDEYTVNQRLQLFEKLAEKIADNNDGLYKGKVQTRHFGWIRATAEKQYTDQQHNDLRELKQVYFREVKDNYVTEPQLIDIAKGSPLLNLSLRYKVETTTVVGKIDELEKGLKAQQEEIVDAKQHEKLQMEVPVL